MNRMDRENPFSSGVLVLQDTYLTQPGRSHGFGAKVLREVQGKTDDFHVSRNGSMLHLLYIVYLMKRR